MHTSSSRVGRGNHSPEKRARRDGESWALQARIVATAAPWRRSARASAGDGRDQSAASSCADRLFPESRDRSSGRCRPASSSNGARRAGSRVARRPGGVPCPRRGSRRRNRDRKGASSEVGRKEVHVRPVMEALPGGLDGHGVRVDSKILELAERIAQMAVCTTEVEQPARWMELRAIKLALEFGSSEHVLDQRPEPWKRRSSVRQSHLFYATRRLGTARSPPLSWSPAVRERSPTTRTSPSLISSDE